LPHIKKPAIVRQKKKIWSWAPDGSPTPRQTGRLTVGRKLTLTSTSTSAATPLAERAAFFVSSVVTGTERGQCKSPNEQLMMWARYPDIDTSPHILLKIFAFIFKIQVKCALLMN
jgi:hypothetical protein